MDAGRAQQLSIWRSWSPERRLSIADELMRMALSAREQRLRARFPGATEAQLRWARVREALRLPIALTPP